jgi:deoxyribose-phosphate aldolase
MNRKILERLNSEHREDFGRFFDHTLLKPDATERDIIALCEEAREYSVAAVCINPVYVSRACSLLKSSTVKIATVVGFPLGAELIRVKMFQAHSAIQDGAQEIDMVINIGALKDQKYDIVYQDIFEVVKECRLSNCICKVIIEADVLSDGEKKKACEIVRDAGAHFVKTSTGISYGGATVTDVIMISECLKNSRLGIKASGGIRTLEQAVDFIEAGATRIGTSSTVNILQEYRRQIS